MLDMVARQRGTLDGFDVIAKGPPGSDPEPWRRAGATWFLTSTGEFAGAAEVARLVRRRTAGVKCRL